MIYYPSLANVVTQADCSQGLNVRSAEGKAIACQSTEGRRRLERSGRHLRGRIDHSGGRSGRLNVDSGTRHSSGFGTSSTSSISPRLHSKGASRIDEDTIRRAAIVTDERAKAWFRAMRRNIGYFLHCSAASLAGWVRQQHHP